MVDGAPSRCIGADGATADGPFVSAASEALGGLAYLDPLGKGYLTNAQAFCTNHAPSEELHGVERTTVWLSAYDSFTRRSVKAARAAMVIRPDGVMVLGAPHVDFGGLGDESELTYPLMFFFFPAYRAASFETRNPVVDPFRTKEPRAFIAAIAPGAIQAMALLPGAGPETDFGHLHRAAPDVVVLPSGNGGPSATSSDDGCSAAVRGLHELPLLLPAALIAVLRRRRKLASRAD